MTIRQLFGHHTFKGHVGFGRHVGIPEATLGLLVLIGLALPFVPVPGEHVTRIAVRFQTADMRQPSSFITHTSSNICYVLSTILSYQDPGSGEFVQVNCGKRADVLARQIHAERDADTTAMPIPASEAP
jgi:hypothetical protein